MSTKSIKVFAPATIANVGPGFDVLGIAIQRPGDFVTAFKQNETGLEFNLENPNSGVPIQNDNVAAHVAKLMLDELKPSFGIHLTLDKQMPIGSGLGSSGASSVAAAVAVNALLDNPLPKIELLRFALEGERLASGTAHADNIAPSLLGGACLIRSYNPLDVIQLPIQNNFFWVVAHPHLIVETKTARATLPTLLPLSVTLSQCGNLACLVTGLVLGDDILIKKSLYDSIAEPLRAPIIPYFYEMRDSVMQVGALGFSISGSGPSVFAITTSLAIANEAAKRIKNIFTQQANVHCNTYISYINLEGAKVLEQKS